MPRLSFASDLEREVERLANLISALISLRLVPKIEIHSFPVQAVEDAIAFVQKHSWHGASIGAWNADPTHTRQAYRKGSILRCSSLGSIEAFIALLAGRSSKTASLEEIRQAAEVGWSGEA